MALRALRRKTREGGLDTRGRAPAGNRVASLPGSSSPVAQLTVGWVYVLRGCVNLEPGQAFVETVSASPSSLTQRLGSQRPTNAALRRESPQNGLLKAVKQRSLEMG